jgi:hypothetical protein
MYERARIPGVLMLRRSRFTRFFAVPVTLVALLSGCSPHKWVNMEPPGDPRAAADGDMPERIRVTYAPEGSARMAVLISPLVIGDSLIGGAPNTERRFEDDYEPPKRLAIALSDITQIEKQKRDAALTAVWVVGGLALAGLLVWGMVAMVEDSMDGMFEGMTLFSLDPQ